MKNSFLITSLLLLVLNARSQTVDSIITAPQTIKVSMSTPQPRLNETFEITVDASDIRDNIFKSVKGRLGFPEDMGSMESGKLKTKVKALSLGKNQMGPFEFYIDKTRYTSAIISYEVIDPLPQTDKGIWIRQIRTGEDAFCIIIEQRIPAVTKSGRTADNGISITTEPVAEEMVEFKYNDSIDGISAGNSERTSSFSSLEKDGENIPFKYSFGIYHFSIKDDKAKIRITRDLFKNLPEDYKFEEIVVQ